MNFYPMTCRTCSRPSIRRKPRIRVNEGRAMSGQLLHLNANALYMELAVPSFVFTPERMVFRERTASGRLTVGFVRIQCGPSASGI